MKDHAERLREQLDGPRDQPVLAVGTQHAIAARLAERAHFDACWVGSLEVCSALGLPDQNLIGFAEMAGVAHRIALATELPVVVDADNGYGSALAMRRAAREFAALGIAGMSVEDNAFPKRNSFDPARGTELADPDDFTARIAGVRDLLAGSPFVLIARTEALIAGLPVEQAIDRAVRYADAGADLVVLHTRDRTGRQAAEVAAAWPRPTPLVSIPTAFPQLTPRELGALGYRMVIYANQLLRASVTAMGQVLEALRDGKAADLEADIAPVSEILRFHQ